MTGEYLTRPRPSFLERSEKYHGPFPAVRIRWPVTKSADSAASSDETVFCNKWYLSVAARIASRDCEDEQCLQNEAGIMKKRARSVLQVVERAVYRQQGRDPMRSRNRTPHACGVRLQWLCFCFHCHLLLMTHIRSLSTRSPCLMVSCACLNSEFGGFGL